MNFEDRDLRLAKEARDRADANRVRGFRAKPQFLVALIPSEEAHESDENDSGTEMAVATATLGVIQQASESNGVKRRGQYGAGIVVGLALLTACATASGAKENSFTPEVTVYPGVTAVNVTASPPGPSSEYTVTVKPPPETLSVSEATPTVETVISKADFVKWTLAQRTNSGGQEIEFSATELTAIEKNLGGQMEFWQKYYKVLVENKVIDGTQVGMKLDETGWHTGVVGGPGISWVYILPDNGNLVEGKLMMRTVGADQSDITRYSLIAPGADLMGRGPDGKFKINRMPASEIDAHYVSIPVDGQLGFKMVPTGDGKQEERFVITRASAGEEGEAVTMSWNGQEWVEVKAEGKYTLADIKAMSTITNEVDYVVPYLQNSGRLEPVTTDSLPKGTVDVLTKNGVRIAGVTSAVTESIPADVALTEVYPIFQLNSVAHGKWLGGPGSRMAGADSGFKVNGTDRPVFTAAEIEDFVQVDESWYLIIKDSITGKKMALWFEMGEENPGIVPTVIMGQPIENLNTTKELFMADGQYQWVDTDYNHRVNIGPEKAIELLKQGRAGIFVTDGLNQVHDLRHPKSGAPRVTMVFVFDTEANLLPRTFLVLDADNSRKYNPDAK